MRGRTADFAVSAYAHNNRRADWLGSTLDDLKITKEVVSCHWRRREAEDCFLADSRTHLGLESKDLEFRCRQHESSRPLGLTSPRSSTQTRVWQ